MTREICRECMTPIPNPSKHKEQMNDLDKFRALLLVRHAFTEDAKIECLKQAREIFMKYSGGCMRVENDMICGKTDWGEVDGKKRPVTYFCHSCRQIHKGWQKASEEEVKLGFRVEPVEKE